MNWGSLPGTVHELSQHGIVRFVKIIMLCCLVACCAKLLVAVRRISDIQILSDVNSTAAFQPMQNLAAQPQHHRQHCQCRHLEHALTSSWYFSSWSIWPIGIKPWELCQGQCLLASGFASLNRAKSVGKYKCVFVILDAPSGNAGPFIAQWTK